MARTQLLNFISEESVKNEEIEMQNMFNRHVEVDFSVEGIKTRNLDLTETNVDE